MPSFVSCIYYKEFFAVKETESKDRIHYTADLINEVNPNLLHLKKIRTKLSKMLSDNFSDHELEKILHKVDSDRHELFIIFADTE